MNIWVNGCFDILHTGHLDLLEFAKNFKDPQDRYYNKNRLIVGIDSDKRVKELKGKERPINDENDRKRILMSLECVDDVVIYDNEEEMCEYIDVCKIHYIIIGDEYRDKRVLCVDNSSDGVVFFPKDENSTTNIIKKIKNI